MTTKMKAPANTFSHVYPDGTTGTVDANGFMDVPNAYVGDLLEAGYTLTSSMTLLKLSQYATRAFTTTAALALAASEFFGAAMVVFRMTGGTTPSAAGVPTAAALAALATNMAVGDSYIFRLINNGSGTVPAFTAETGFTFTGTMTVATNTWRDFQVTRTAAETFTVQSIGTGTDS